jgi:hypothetical protein
MRILYEAPNKLGLESKMTQLAFPKKGKISCNLSLYVSYMFRPVSIVSVMLVCSQNSQTEGAE